jgi:hypothetical protein
MNFVHTITPVVITLSMENKLEQCSKVLINCFDDWTIWSGNQTTCLDLSQCSLSSGGVFNLYQYTPIKLTRDNYDIGQPYYSNLYNGGAKGRALCFPGNSPFYSPFMNYPNYPYLWIS